MIAFLIFSLITGVGAFFVKKKMTHGKLKTFLFWILTILALIPIGIIVVGFLVGFGIGLYNRIM